MARLKLFTSNRLERLSAKLAEVLASPPSERWDPLAPETVLVESRGMQRWVSLELARRHGVCANVDFPFPNHFVHRMFRTVLGDVPETSPFECMKMAWKLMELLPPFLERPGFESLKGYMGNAEGDLKRFQLAVRLADTFDQYLLFRPEMVLDWERGRGDHWQAVLWRELARSIPGLHRAALRERFPKAVSRVSPEVVSRLPSRVSAFGISSLPPFHMEVLESLSRLMEVNLFFMNPSPGPWCGEDSAGGNRLLHSMGALGRDFFTFVRESHLLEAHPFFTDPFRESEETSENREGNPPAEPHRSLLRCLQSDIYHFRNREEAEGAKRILAPGDRSLEIHCCHGPMREVEALHDRLLDLFDEDPQLKPRDILVMMPDMETYGPYVQAVFSAPPDEGARIPFEIADRARFRERNLVETFMAVLDLVQSRFGVTEVLRVLESPDVRRRFGLKEVDLDLLRRWAEEAGIRWGIDAGARRREGLPAFAENSWEFGLNRLLLGYAMPGEGSATFEGILPYDEMEGEKVQVLGRLAELTDRLFSRRELMEARHSPADWADILMELLEAFFLPDQDTEREMQRVREALSRLANAETEGLYSGALDLPAVQAFLGRDLEEGESARGFMTGGVTFCAMLPMRSIPFKVICLLGMNADAFPKPSRKLGFDLIARDPRPGDRSPRNRDRYLFLEALLSARQKLYISYTGRSIQDNSEFPPSVLVSELLDAVEKGYAFPDGDIGEHLLVQHRLQAFNPEYFRDDGRLFSYSRHHCEAARQLLADRPAPQAFIPSELPPPEPEWKTVDLDSLASFFSNPSRFLLTRRLQMHLDEGASLLEEAEPFSVEGLSRYFLAQHLLERRLAGVEMHRLRSSVRASGQLPPGVVGQCVYEDLAGRIERFARRTADYMKGHPLKPLELDMAIGDFRLSGKIAGLYSDRMVRYRYAAAKGKDHLGLWICHLALNCLGAPGYPRESVLAGLEKDEWCAWRYLPPDQSEAILEDLLSLYRQGLVRPLPFFSESAWEYVRQRLKNGKSRKESLWKAKDTWTGGSWARGEKEDLYYRLCFGKRDPFDSEDAAQAFEELAVQVFEPLLTCVEQIKEGQ